MAIELTMRVVKIERVRPRYSESQVERGIHTPAYFESSVVTMEGSGARLRVECPLGKWDEEFRLGSEVTVTVNVAAKED